MLRKSTNELSIKPKMSRTTFMAITIGGVFALFVMLYLAYSYGMKSGHTKYETDRADIRRLNETISELESQLRSSDENLIFAQRQQQIQEEAYKQMSNAYANSEQKNQVLGSRLDFYRSIISPEDGQSGPSIQDLKHSYKEGTLSFDVTLVQAIKHKHQVRGNLRVLLIADGKVIGQWPSGSARSISYQYFQQVSGSITRSNLAEDAKLKVELALQDGELLERTFDLATSAKSSENSSS